MVGRAILKTSTTWLCYRSAKQGHDPISEEGLDYSGIAKGYAVDKVAELLEKNDIANYFLEIGRINQEGQKYSQPWVLA